MGAPYSGPCFRTSPIAGIKLIRTWEYLSTSPLVSRPASEAVRIDMFGSTCANTANKTREAVHVADPWGNTC